MAVMMNELFDLAAANLSGYDSYTSPGTYMSGTGTPTFFDAEYYRSGVDQFFFTLLYVVLIYILATSCFKLIDMVPNSILRWMGSSVTSFGDSAQDAAQSLTQYAAIGGGMVFQQGLGGVQGGIQGMKQSGDAAAQLKASQEAAKAGGG